MVVVPAVIPETIPDDEPMVAAEVLLLNHVPPDIELLRVDVAPSQAFSVPEIADGVAFTVYVAVL